MDAVIESNPQLNLLRNTAEPLLNESYSLPDDADRAMLYYHAESAKRRHWRLNEARDFIFLMSEMLRRTDAPFLGFHQDDTTWAQPPELLGTPIQSLYHFRPGGSVAVGDEQLGRGFQCKHDAPCQCAL
eukprot:SAG22_NODE_7970_length_694_cov_0.996639_1_plen_128_part_10